MPWLVYKSTDSGAPVLTGQNQVGMSLLKLILCGPSNDGTGFAYGSMPCAGWSVVMSETTKTVIRPPSIARCRPYFRLYQPNSDPNVYINGYSLMTDVDTGRDPFPSSEPTPSQRVSFYALAPASVTTNATVRDWMIAADERTFIYAVKTGNGSTGGRWYLSYFGEFASKVEADPYQACIFASRHDYQEFYSPFGCRWITQGINASAFDQRIGVYVMRNYDGGPDAVRGSYAWHMGVQPRSINQYGVPISGIFPGTNPADGKLWVSHIPICTAYKNACVRGVLRGVYMSLSSLDYYADLSTASMQTDDGVANLMMVYTFGKSDSGETSPISGNIWLQTGGPVPYT